MEIFCRFIGWQIRKPLELPERLPGHLIAEVLAAFVDWLLKPPPIQLSNRDPNVAYYRGMTFVCYGVVETLRPLKSEYMR